MEKLKLKSGKIIEFDYDLVDRGAIFYVSTKLAKKERKQLKHELQSERDVVRIIYN